MKKATLSLALALPFALAFAEARADLPLPDAPVQLVVPDASALDAALGGGLRAALEGDLPASDPVAAAWRRTRVGGKLESQWALFTKDLSITWKDLMALKPRSLGFALLAVGDLEAVLAVETPLAQLTLALPAGAEKAHRGAAYHLVSKGGGDESTAARRLGLAWARVDGTLLLATSERALLLSLDAAVEKKSTKAFLPGLASLRLDLDQLWRDLYFRREFLFEGERSKGVLLAALRSEAGSLVEVREGVLESAAPAFSWPTEGRAVAASGYETDASRFLSALRGGLLEPVPSLSDRPVAAKKPLPDATAGADRYLVDITKAAPADARGEEGELPQWAQLVKGLGLTGFGWELGTDGVRRLVLKAPPSTDARFAELARLTSARRAGRAAEVKGEVQVGPDLPAVAWLRTGDYLWLARQRAELQGVPTPAVSSDLVRWSRLDLKAMAEEGKLWAKAEGVFSPDQTRPFSDRILGLLGWVPRTSSIAVERKAANGRFTERVVFVSK